MDSQLQYDVMIKGCLTTVMTRIDLYMQDVTKVGWITFTGDYSIKSVAITYTP